MFDLPDAKRVRRSDLYSSPSSSQSPSQSLSNSRSSTPDSDLEAKLEARLKSLYGASFDLPTKPAPADGTVEADEKSKCSTSPSHPPDAKEAQKEKEGPQEEEPTHLFRLFSTPLPSKIHLDPTPPTSTSLDPTEEGRFLRTPRDPRVWVVPKASGERLEGFERVAVSGEEVLRGSRVRNWGLEVGWRVVHLRGSTSTRRRGHKLGEGRVEGEDGGMKKKKAGKKRRIVLRMREKKAAAEEEKRKREKERKVEGEREKKTRRNREKKVKRKMKLKEQQALGGVKEGAGGEGDGGKVEEVVVVDAMDVD